MPPSEEVAQLLACSACRRHCHYSAGNPETLGRLWGTPFLRTPQPQTGFRRRLPGTVREVLSTGMVPWYYQYVTNSGNELTPGVRFHRHNFIGGQTDVNLGKPV
jgi:hypothetical protein